MRGSALQPEIHELIEKKDFATLKGIVREIEIHDLGELLSELEGEDLAVAFRLLPQQTAADIFGDLPLERQEELLTLMTTEKTASILNDMPPDERTELLEELPGAMAQRLLASLRGDEARIARSLLAYPEDSIGRLMTPEYVAVRPDWTVAQVLDHIRKVGPAKETIKVIYVTDAAGKLLDDVQLEQIVLAAPEATVHDLMDEQFAALGASEDQESAVDIFRKYDAVALPVVNNQGVLVGIVTVDDVMDIAEEEYTEDIQKMAAVGVLEASYFQTGYFDMLRKRMPWLVLLLAAEVLTVVVLTSFEENLPQAVIVLMAVFVPLINSPAGNTGSQMAGLIIRGLAVQEIELSDWRKVLWREIMIGLTLGITLGALGLPTALMFGRPMHIAVAVGLAIMLSVSLGNVIGSMLPFVFKRLGFDPAVTSGPFIASLMDVMCMLIYFSLGLGILSLLHAI